MKLQLPRSRGALADLDDGSMQPHRVVPFGAWIAA